MVMAPEIVHTVRRSLIEDKETLAKIRELWLSKPRPSKADIAKQVRRPYTSVQHWIKEQIKQGNLPE